ncbi:hypothetical protein UA08_00337 [Talaromyces atroroseus]|uniref:Uncharacterized protein n=1 Tax=Talaromyces atroroseus TaxID=1441469 RepID=A0A225B348_TALAT|nr:hypothetical protein UA08_00337 [Talaromyces atroroseus]OKL64148.1 hypothetical protein UA08_00337 [Talaromyces atroroseus]
MAQNALGRRLFHSRSGLQQTLSPLVQKRCQSTKAVPSFSPTSSPELDQKLNHIRENLFIPMYLAENQKRLVFRQRYRARLNFEQVNITIGDEEFPLRPADRQKLPQKREINQAVEAMKTSQDWKNFIPLLIGSRHSNYKYKTEHFEKWVRLAGKSDAFGSILEAAKQSSRTGFSFSHRTIAFQFAYALHQKAEKASFKGEQVVTALRHAEQAAQLMDWPEHTNPQLAEDPKRQPFFIGLLTELSAARAIDEAGGADVDGKVRSYVQKLLATWEFAAFDRKADTWYDTNALLLEAALIHSGLKMAQKVKDVSNDAALMKTIAERVKRLKTVAYKGIKKAPEKVIENPTLGLREAQAIA